MSTIASRAENRPHVASLAQAIFDFFARHLMKPAPAAAARAVDTGAVWDLYRMSRGADAVSPAVSRRLAQHARSH